MIKRALAKQLGAKVIVAYQIPGVIFYNHSSALSHPVKVVLSSLARK